MYCLLLFSNNSFLNGAELHHDTPINKDITGAEPTFYNFLKRIMGAGPHYFEFLTYFLAHLAAKQQISWVVSLCWSPLTFV